MDDQGLVHFFDDIYGFDADLEKVLSKSYRYHGITAERGKK